MKTILILVSLVLFTGCGGGSIATIKVEEDLAIIHVQNKSMHVVKEKGAWSNFLQQAIILDHDGTEYRFSFDEDISKFNLLKINRKYKVYSRYGYIRRVEEIM